MATVTLLRALTGWPAEVPEGLLAQHLAAGEQRALAVAGLATPPVDAGFDRAACWFAAASVLPVLHTFALSGAAKVGRLEGTVEWRFLAPGEVKGLCELFEARAFAALSALGDVATTPLGGIGLRAI